MAPGTTQKWEKADVDHLESLIRAEDSDDDPKPGQMRLDNMEEFGKYGAKQFSNRFYIILNKIKAEKKAESKCLTNVFRSYEIRYYFI